MVFWIEFPAGKKTIGDIRFRKRRPLASLLLTVVLFSAGVLYFQMFLRPHSEDAHPEVQFAQRLQEVCAQPRLPPLQYNGVESFFNFITTPDLQFCYSWLQFGGEKIVIPTQKESECLDEIRKEKYICFNEEYEMTKDPCLVYSFTKDQDQQFERDMHMFSCETHVFDANQISSSEHVKRTEFWMEHSWDISEYPYDTVAQKEKVVKRRSLDFISHVLDHEGKVIKIIKSDSEGREWILLKQIIAHHNLLDVRQIAVRIHLPVRASRNASGTARHEMFRELFQVFQGLNCLGYKYIMVRPAPYYKGRIRVPEMNKTFFSAYEVNFAKVLNSQQI